MHKLFKNLYEKSQREQIILMAKGLIQDRELSATSEFKNWTEANIKLLTYPRDKVFWDAIHAEVAERIQNETR